MGDLVFFLEAFTGISKFSTLDLEYISKQKIKKQKKVVKTNLLNRTLSSLTVL